MWWKNKNNFNSKSVAPFLRSNNQKHNIARLSHLDSLNLDLRNKFVLEIGAGIDDYSLFYLYKGCKVVATDGRKEFVIYINGRLEIESLKLDVEKELYKLKSLPKFDIVHCYGLLYHINNPKEFILSISDKAVVLLLETCVSSDFAPYGPNIVSEDKNNPTQAKSGNGCRPTRKWIADILNSNFDFVYFPKIRPDHNEFPIDWNKETTDNQLIWTIFIASKGMINNGKLTDVIPITYRKYSSIT